MTAEPDVVLTRLAKARQLIDDVIRDLKAQSEPPASPNWGLGRLSKKEERDMIHDPGAER